MTVYSNSVTILFAEVQYGVVANALDPVIVHIVVFTGDTTPVDATVSACVLCENFWFGIQQWLKGNDVSSLTGANHVICQTSGG